MTNRKIARPRRARKPDTKPAAPKPFRLPDERVKDALDTLDRALLITIANTAGRNGSGIDASNLAHAAKASTDLRTLLTLDRELGGAS
ncbi:MAG TPA: hypothetical protein VHE30_26005 [Polyangiaceae bacterium]|nr:hypothetical protein [Polyangiaceae bacterium]